MGEKEISDPEDACEPVNDGLIWNCIRQADTNPAAKVLDAPDAKILQRPLDIAHEPLFEIFPIAAFEGKFVIVDDRATHNL
jgi:hypothetical protein